MKIILLSFVVTIMFLQEAMSNNVQVSNVQLTGQNTTDDFTMVEFDIIWENSWRYSGGPNNWDAAWIFVKYKVGANGTWQHAWLNNVGHMTCANTILTNGLLTPGTSFNSMTNPVMGTFLYRSTPGSGTFNCQNVQLRWNYGANGISDDAQVDVKVIAIEMVYIPQGSFYVGSGGSERSAFYTYPDTTTSFLINSEASILVGPSVGSLYYNVFPGTFPGDRSGPIPAGFPKGFNAFYAMKHEISQQAYIDFLNTLNRSQQINRVRAGISGTSPTQRFVMANANTTGGRNSITCQPTIPPMPAPVEFFCDLNANWIMHEVSDGQGIAANYMNYFDVAAYLDWASLRLMTELEFEKCGRGIDVPTRNEFAWGNSIIYLHEAIVNSGQPTESVSNPISNCTGLINNGPLRTGIFARPSTNRTTSGSGSHGCLDISGNLEECGVSAGSVDGRNYQGIHGNGLLTNAGFADVTTWPSSGGGASGIFRRGGGFGIENLSKQLSDRASATSNYYDAFSHYGGRGVRTAQ